MDCRPLSPVEALWQQKLDQPWLSLGQQATTVSVQATITATTGGDCHALAVWPDYNYALATEVSTARPLAKQEN